MISLVIDKIENAPLYYGLGERFRKALEWLAAVDPSTLSPGEKVPIDGETANWRGIRITPTSSVWSAAWRRQAMP